MFGSYFSGRTGAVDRDPDSGSRLEVCITGGVPQGSVVGPLLWNITYDEVLKLRLPSGTELLGFADDTLVVSSGKSIPELEERVNEALGLVAGKISDLGLEIATTKTEAVLFTNRYNYAIPRIEKSGDGFYRDDVSRYRGRQNVTVQGPRAESGGESRTRRYAVGEADAERRGSL